MGIIEFFKKIGSDAKKFATKVFAENQFVEYDNREDLKTAIVTSGMSKEAGSLLVREHDQSVTEGRNFVDTQNNDIRITPADRISDDLEQDSTIRDIKKGVSTPVPTNDINEREHGGKTRERSL